VTPGSDTFQPKLHQILVSDEVAGGRGEVARNFKAKEFLLSAQQDDDDDGAAAGKAGTKKPRKRHSMQHLDSFVFN